MGEVKLSYTVEEAAKATGLSRSRLYLEIASGALVTWKSGRRRMVTHKALEAFIAKCERESAGRAAA